MSTVDPFRQRTKADPWRTAYEIQAAGVWAVAAVITCLYWLFSGLPQKLLFAMLLVCGVFTIWRFDAAAKVWNLRINLLGKGWLWTKLRDYFAVQDADPTALWLGKGFKWEREHSQRLYDLLKREQKVITPPGWYSKLVGFALDAQEPVSVGKPFIHGVCEQEEDLKLPFALLEGNTLILGTTGAGKTTLLKVIVAACIRRGDTVFVIDPKGDLGLADTMAKSCELTPGREQHYRYFHTAHAEKSCRWDVLRNFDAFTSVASRIAGQIPTKTGAPDTFSAFNWHVLLTLGDLLITCGERPSIASLRKSVNGGVDELLERALTTHFEKVRPGVWRREAEDFVEDAKDGKFDPPTRRADSRYTGYIYYYKNLLSRTEPSEALAAGIALAFHDRAHYSKMTPPLIPVLGALDFGDIGGLISPKYSDIDDHRAILDVKTAVEGNNVVYFGLNALPDTQTSHALAAILIADLAAFAGWRYNHFGGEMTRITLIIDEASEVANVPLQQIASKGRGAGMVVWAASQTIPDWVAKLANHDRAFSTLGNFNNLICMRIVEPTTCEFVTMRLGQVYVDEEGFSLNTSAASDAAGTGFSGGEGVNVRAQLTDVVPVKALTELPNHQYFALLAGGMLVKGRQPVLSD